MLQRLSYKLQSFMYGRNGTDALCWALLILGVVLNLIGSYTGLYFCSLLAYIPMCLALYRMFSRNLTKRRQENARFLRLLRREPKTGETGYQQGNYYYNERQAAARKPSRVGLAARLKDREHRYFRCPRCARTVRVPRGRGTIRITCPKCGERFEKKT